MSDAPDQVTDPLGFAAFKAGFDGVARDDAPLFTALSHAVQQRRFWADIAAAIDTTIPAIDSWYRIRRAKLGERS